MEFKNLKIRKSKSKTTPKVSTKRRLTLSTLKFKVCILLVVVVSVVDVVYFLVFLFCSRIRRSQRDLKSRALFSSNNVIRI